MLAFFGFEVEQTGVVFQVGALEELHHWHCKCRAPLLISSSWFSGSMLRSSQMRRKDDAVDGHLDGEIKLALVMPPAGCAARCCAPAGHARLQYPPGRHRPPRWCPSWPLVSAAYLSKEPFQTASREKMAAISSHFSIYSLYLRNSTLPVAALSEGLGLLRQS